jgi:cytoskeletal protein CcmA (bactofilin family)
MDIKSVRRKAPRPRIRSIAVAVACLVLGMSAPFALPALAKSAKGAGPVVQINGDGNAIETAGASVVIRGKTESIRAAGAVVDINATVSGQVYAAGAQVTIDGEVSGDVRAAGGLVEVQGTLGGDGYLAGAVVRFDGNAAKNLNAGGATVAIGSNATITGDLTAGGASVTVAGTIDGATDLSGSAIIFNGTANGTVTASGDEIIVGPTAHINGDLVVRSRTDPVVENGATITGQIRVEEPRGWWALPGWLWAAIGAVVIAAGAILTGAILILIGRATFEEGLGNAAFRPISSGFIGLATLILLPIVAVILMTTVIGLSFGVALLMVLPFLLVAGHAQVATCIGVWMFDRSGGPRSAGRLILYMIAGAIVIAVVWLIPWVGPIVAFLAMLVGTGAYLRSLNARMRRLWPAST